MTTQIWYNTMFLLILLKQLKGGNRKNYSGLKESKNVMQLECADLDWVI